MPPKSKKIEYIINENGCHICTSHCYNKAGYPLIKRNSKQYRMSRYLWEQKNGPISEGIFVCHKCDTPACINVEHFFLGTNDDNMKDMVFKDRQAKGKENGNSKLTEDQVLQIRKESGILVNIAEKYKIKKSQVANIRNRKTWEWLEEKNDRCRP